MDNNIAIKAIEDKLEKLSAISKSEQFNTWQKSTTLTLVNVFSESDKRVKSFEEIQSYISYFDSGIDRTQKAINEAKELLENLIKDIKDFGIPKKASNLENNSGINVHVNQHNSQNQSTIVIGNIELIMDSLKYGLSGIQIEELKEILESDQESKEKKKSFAEKIKSFGSDVSSNILANLLTSPQVYEQLGGML